jgi:hypothetical protein
LHWAGRGFIATSAGHDFDCVSRFFCPSFGIGVDEDPVTGSAHCSIAPLWADRLKKSVVRAWQASAEGGELLCEVGPTTVTIGAPATPFERWSRERRWAGAEPVKIFDEAATREALPFDRLIERLREMFPRWMPCAAAARAPGRNRGDTGNSA